MGLQERWWSTAMVVHCLRLRDTQIWEWPAERKLLQACRTFVLGCGCVTVYTFTRCTVMLVGRMFCACQGLLWSNKFSLEPLQEAFHAASKARPNLAATFLCRARICNACETYAWGLVNPGHILSIEETLNDVQWPFWGSHLRLCGECNNHCYLDDTWSQAQMQSSRSLKHLLRLCKHYNKLVSTMDICHQTASGCATELSRFWPSLFMI